MPQAQTKGTQTGHSGQTSKPSGSQFGSQTQQTSRGGSAVQSSQQIHDIIVSKETRTYSVEELRERSLNFFQTFVGALAAFVKISEEQLTAMATATVNRVITQPMLVKKGSFFPITWPTSSTLTIPQWSSLLSGTVQQIESNFAQISRRNHETYSPGAFGVYANVSVRELEGPNSLQSLITVFQTEGCSGATLQQTAMVAYTRRVCGISGTDETYACPGSLWGGRGTTPTITSSGAIDQFPTDLTISEFAADEGIETDNVPTIFVVSGENLGSY